MLSNGVECEVDNLKEGIEEQMDNDEKKDIETCLAKEIVKEKTDTNSKELIALGETMVSAYQSMNVEPLFSFVSSFKDSLINSSSFSSSISSMAKQFASEIAQITESSTQTLQGIVSFSREIITPFRQFYQYIADPLIDLIELLCNKELAEDGKRLRTLVSQEALDAEWVPHFMLCPDLDENIELMEMVLFAIQSTKKSKNRVRKIDKIVFDYYTDKRVEKIKKGWRRLHLPSHLIKIMYQAVQAYHRKEYALTVSALSPLWERIIRDKANSIPLYDDKGELIKGEKLSRQYLLRLIETNESEKVFHSFYEDYVLYDCRSDEQANSNVPGRNSTSHGWYSKYPRKKAALNAILFTDFLLNLEPLKNKDTEKETA